MGVDYAQATQLITDISRLVDTYSQNAKAYTDQAVVSARGYITFDDVKIDAPKTITVKPFDTNMDFSVDFGNQYNAILARLGPEYKSMMDDFMNRFMNGCAFPAAEAWLCDVIKNGGTGIPIEVENAIYNRAKDRENKQELQARDQAITEFSARGFSLPNSVLYSRLAKISSEKNQAISQANREVVIKQAEIEIENIRFAVDKAIQIRQSLWGALFNFLNSLFERERAAANYGNIFVDSKTRLYGSMYQYYDALVRIESLNQQNKISNAQINMDLRRLAADTWKTEQTLRVNAAVSSAQAMGSIASSAAASRNAVVTAVASEVTNIS